MARPPTFRFDDDEIDQLNFYNDFYLLHVKREKGKSNNQILASAYDYRGDTLKNATHNGETRVPIALTNFQSFINELDLIVTKGNFPYLERTKEIFEQGYKEFKRKILAKYTAIEAEKKATKKQKKQDVAPHPKKKSSNHTPEVSPTRTLPSKNNSIHQSGKFIEKFVKTRWFCYEYQKGGISRKTIQFFDLNSHGYCEFIHLSSDSGLGSWQGDARFIDADHLLVGICRNSYNADKTERFYTHFTIMVDDRAEDISLCVGHKTFFHAGNHHVVSKTIVLTKVDDLETDFKPLLLDFSSLESGTHKLNENIHLFLNSKHLNRLTTPHKRPTIYNFSTFQEWIQPHKYRSKVNESIVGAYHLYYKHLPEDENFVIEYFIISKSLSGQLSGYYCKKNSGDKRKYWDGLISENIKTRTMSVTLEGGKKKGEELDHYDEPLFLMLTMPEDEEENVDTLVGVITGVRDGNKGPVARLVLISKFTVDNETLKEMPCKEFDLELVKEFFTGRKNRSRVRPPHDTSIASFENLKRSFK